MTLTNYIFRAAGWDGDLFVSGAHSTETTKDLPSTQEIIQGEA